MLYNKGQKRGVYRMKKSWTAIMLMGMLLLGGCGQREAVANSYDSAEMNRSEKTESIEPAESAEAAEPGAATDMTENDGITDGKLPGELSRIPESYFTNAEHQGMLVELFYDTYESMTYEQKSKVLHKRAIVYLPYGYSEDAKYNVFYLMHGGWSDETAYLGTPNNPGGFKNVLDHAMEDGKIVPMIVVCPTYNNESEKDSWDYSLAIQLTDNYHNELIYDLISAVEGSYSTYAKETTSEGLIESRDHRAFCGFSMGSVATWRTFQYCLDYFHYFMPSSGNLTSDGEYMASMVRDSGHEWNDFFIFAASGTDDFAYSAFKHQIEAMASVQDGTFRFADNEAEGNLYFLEQEGGTHNGEYAMEYFYNGLCWIWQ